MQFQAEAFGNMRLLINSYCLRLLIRSSNWQYNKSIDMELGTMTGEQFQGPLTNGHAGHASALQYNNSRDTGLGSMAGEQFQGLLTKGHPMLPHNHTWALANNAVDMDYGMPDLVNDSASDSAVDTDDGMPDLVNDSASDSEFE
jgi:hypothetical protein